MVQNQNIFEQLKIEHQEVKSLLKKAEEATESERTALLEEIEHKLIPHARGEEKTLYALLYEKVKDSEEEEAIDLTNEAYEEHRVVDQLMADLKKTDASHETWLAKLTVIKENLEHHIKEEEEELFKKAKKFLSSEEIDELHAAYLSAKERFEESLPTQGQISERTPSPETPQSLN